ncbi:MAG: DUF1425 domain-containing protein [Kiritimatiellia bacterium]|jgi:uncharacterized protein YcfL
MKKHTLLSVVGVVALIALGGCRTPPSAGITIESYPQNSMRVNSRILGGWLSVAEVNTAKKNDLLVGQVAAQNSTQKDCQFEYRFRWLDEDGLELTTTMSVWTPVSVAAMEKKMMQGIAPSKNAANFVFDVRFRRPSMRWTR